jgi:hypothetical protein
MAKGNPPAGHQPLSYRDRLRLNAAIKHLRSRFHSVRIAAHKEIQAILHKKRGVTRLREWVTKTSRATVRKVTPKPLHKALRVKEKTAPAQARAKGTATPLVKEMPAHGLRAPGGFGQTTADLRERARNGARPQAPAQQPQRGTPQPARMTAGRKSFLSRMTRHRPAPAPVLPEERANRAAPRQTPEMAASGAQQRWERDRDNAVRQGRQHREPPPWTRSPDLNRTAAPLPHETVRPPRLRPER